MENLANDYDLPNFLHPNILPVNKSTNQALNQTTFCLTKEYFGCKTYRINRNSAVNCVPTLLLGNLIGFLKIKSSVYSYVVVIENLYKSLIDDIRNDVP